MAINEELVAQEATFIQEDSEPPIPPSDIVAYNELRSCADLYRMHSNGKLEIQPDFQREVVWRQDDQSRFIDSLVKQLPIPSMCFSLDYKTQKWKVIDGLQRMSSIIRFLGDSEWKLSDLSDIHPKLRGVTNFELKNGNDEQKRLYALVEDVTIPVTVIRCDYTQRSHMLYLFTIFHRLNSGGVRLTNQEIRNCIYSGAFNDALKNFDKNNKDWKVVKRRIWGSMERFRSIEVLLRILAFSENRNVYDGNLARFLNSYMHQVTNAQLGSEMPLIEKLAVVMGEARSVLASESRGKLSLVLVEALLVALFTTTNSTGERDAAALRACYENMISNVTFSETARYAVTSLENVRLRLGAAINAFSE